MDKLTSTAIDVSRMVGDYWGQEHIVAIEVTEKMFDILIKNGMIDRNIKQLLIKIWEADNDKELARFLGD